jgi:uncharacterized protein with NRDE domain
MCLILFAWQAHPRYSLVLAANRDEFHARPTAAAGFWEDEPDTLAGRDLQAGGTWLGVSRSGRFSAITNYREPVAPGMLDERSRGHLVRDFLQSGEDPPRYARELALRADSFRGFNLLMGTHLELSYVSNRGAGPAALSQGTYGLSNHLLDTDWPKVHAGKIRLQSLLEANEPDPEALLDLLADRSLTPGEMPVDMEPVRVHEHLMNHYFIVSPAYGTRSSTVLLVDRDGNVRFIERQFGVDGKETTTQHFAFTIG